VKRRQRHRRISNRHENNIIGVGGINNKICGVGVSVVMAEAKEAAAASAIIGIENSAPRRPARLSVVKRRAAMAQRCFGAWRANQRRNSSS